MNEPIVIPKKQQLPKSMDYPALKAEGIEHAQNLSGDIWTDYNVHDPGVTILEQLCYALTEAGYKTHFDVKDILYAKGQGKFELDYNALYEVYKALPCSALTILDYRKLLIDYIPAIKNAWLIPLEQTDTGIHIRGLYEVLLQIDKTVSKAKDDDVIQEVYDLLSEHRNLCEDISSVKVLQTEEIGIVADINISPNVIGESILAKIAFELSDALTPQIHFHTLDELLEKGVRVEDAFNGPLPKHGFIDEEDLHKSDLHLLGIIHKSKLIKLISEIEGVTSVDNLAVIINGEEIYDEVLQFEQGIFPTLDVRRILHHQNNIEKQALQLYVSDILYNTDYYVARQTYNMLVTKYRQRLQRPLDLRMPMPTSDKKRSDIEHFDSIQYSFPPNYGIGEYGLSSRSTPERRGQAKQLKAYLMLFEQIIANHLAQVVNAHHLFSTKEELEQTYFHQVLKDIPNIKDLRNVSDEKTNEILADFSKKFDNVPQRRNRFLDHLLARFSESFMSDTFNALNRQAIGSELKEFETELAKAKILFLKNYIELSRNRGKGAIFGNDINTHQVSGLKKRISLLFNMTNYQHRTISSAPESLGVEWKTEDLKKEINPDNFSFNFVSEDSDLLSEVLVHGTHRNNYEIRPKGNSLFVYFHNPETKAEIPIYTNMSVEICEDAISRLIVHLKKLNRESEGFHLVEHVLLRPCDTVKHRFYIKENGEKLLESEAIYLRPQADKSKFVQYLLQYGKSAKNYIIKKEGEGYTISIKDNKSVVVAYVRGFLIKESAKEAAKKILKYLKSKNAETIEEQLFSEEVAIPAGLFTDDPYSLRFSVVIASWGAYFQNQEMQTIFEDILRLYAPAHLIIDCHWLGIDEMRLFEKIYQAWLDEKHKSEPTQPLLDRLSYALLIIMKSYKNPDDSAIQSKLENVIKEFG